MAAGSTTHDMAGVKFPVFRVLLLPLLLLAVLPCFGQGGQALLEIGEIEFVASADLLPPPADAGWKPTMLPWGSIVSDPDNGNQVYWFRFSLEQPPGDELQALYFFRYNQSIDVFFNGARIGGDSYRDGFQTIAWNRPRLVDIQNSNWQPGLNTVHVRFQSSFLGGGFAQILTGPSVTLNALLEERLFRQITINLWCLIFGFLVTLLSFVLWLVRRQDKVNILFAGMSACWLVVSAHMVIYYNPFPYALWLPLVHVAIDCWIFLLYLFLDRVLELNSRRSYQVICGWLLLALIWHVMMVIEVWWFGAYIIHLLGSLLLLHTLYRVFSRAWQQRQGLAIVITGVVLLQFALFITDFVHLMLWRGNDWESAFHMSQLAFPLMQIVFLGLLLKRFLAALEVAETLNRDLEARVEASRSLIERAFAEQRQRELDQAAERERVKIYRDLHDDLGSKLLSIVHAGRETRLGSLASAALESLRDSVSRANYPDQLLADFLADLREETELRLAGSGHRVIWKQPFLLPELILPANVSYNLNRIFKELVSNIIRHARADRVTVDIQKKSDHWVLSIADNGIGFDDSAALGNGVNNIRKRADEISARLDWKTAVGQGLTVRVSVNLLASRAEPVLEQNHG